MSVSTIDLYNVTIAIRDCGDQKAYESWQRLYLQLDSAAKSKVAQPAQATNNRSDEIVAEMERVVKCERGGKLWKRGRTSQAKGCQPVKSNE